MFRRRAPPGSSLYGKISPDSNESLYLHKNIQAHKAVCRADWPVAQYVIACNIMRSHYSDHQLVAFSLAVQLYDLFLGVCYKITQLPQEIRADFAAGFNLYEFQVLEGIAARRGLGIAEEHPQLLAQLVDEYAAGVGLGNVRRQLAHCLTLIG